MNLEKGIRQVTCRECGVSGEIRIGATLARGRKVRAAIAVPHLETCSQYRRRQPRHLKKKDWQSQEKKMNQRMGIRDTLASGAVGKDGDGRSFHGWRTEAKQTDSTSFRLTYFVWEKLVEGALLTGEEPVLFLQMRDKLATIPRVVIRKDLWDAIGDGELHQVEGFTNPKSFRITREQPTPLLINALTPPGVMLFEDHFLNLKENLP